MNSRIREYVEKLFAQAPKTRKIHELKEEMIANMTEKYGDLTAAGKSPDEAFGIVIAGTGDVDELIASVSTDDPFNQTAQQAYRQRSAVLVSVAVMLYIMSFGVMVFMTEMLHWPDAIAVPTMLLMWAVATGLLIYNYMSRPRYTRQDDTMVEEFKEWRSSNDQSVQLRKSVTSAMWTLIVAIYLIMSFVFHNWHISWIIFVVGAAVEQIIKALFEMRRR